MADVIHKQTLEQRFSVNTPDYPTEFWLRNPDLSAVTGVPKAYWKIVDGRVLEMDAGEKQAVDALHLAAQAARAAELAEMTAVQEVRDAALTTLQAIEDGIDDATLAQAKTAIKHLAGINAKLVKAVARLIAES